MSKTEVDEKTKARWAFGELWNKLHFGHISKNDRVQNALQTSYRIGLELSEIYTKCYLCKDKSEEINDFPVRNSSPQGLACKG